MKNKIMKRLNELEKIVGNTPLIKIPYYFAGKYRKVYAKLEWYNPTGSIKDRAAFSMIKSAYEKDLLEPQKRIIEATSGNMGLSLCFFAAQLGNPVTLVMPKSVSEERKKLFNLYGIDVHYTETMQEAVEMAEELAKKLDAFWPNQFDNSDNVFGQSKIANEIMRSIKGSHCRLNNGMAFISGVGSSGTLTGVAYGLHEHMPNNRIYCIEISQAPIFSNYTSGTHHIQGLSDSRIPNNFVRSLVDYYIKVDENDVIAMAQKLNKAGYPVGLSGAANFLGAVLSAEPCCFTVFPDDNKKYLSTELTTPRESALVNNIRITKHKIL